MLAFLRPFSLAEWWQHALIDYTWLTRYELAGQALFLGSFGLLFGLYYWAFLHVRRRPRHGSLAIILGLQLGMGLVLAGIYPVSAIDLYDYVLYGRLGAYWGANPLAHPPSQFPLEPMLAFSYWPNEPSIYGPLWQLVSQWVVAGVDGQLPQALYAFKLLAVGAALLTSLCIWATLRRVEPGLAPAGALLYGWNPLQQLEVAGNGHNDSLMVLFLALALLLLALGVRPLALPAYTAGLLVKVTLVPLGPVVALATLLPWRRSRLRQLGLGLALSLLMIVILYAPFWEGRASLPFLDRGNWFTASPPTLLRELLRRWLDFEAAGRTAAVLSAAAFGLVSLALLAKLISSGGARSRPVAVKESARTGYHIFFAYLVIACLWWQPWYLLVLLALAAVAGDRLLADRANLFCIGGLLSYPVFKYIWSVHQTDWQLDYGRIMALSVVAIFTLPLVHLILSGSRVSLPPMIRGRIS